MGHNFLDTQYDGIIKYLEGNNPLKCKKSHPVPPPISTPLVLGISVPCDGYQGCPLYRRGTSIIVPFPIRDQSGIPYDSISGPPRTN